MLRVKNVKWPILILLSCLLPACSTTGKSPHVRNTDPAVQATEAHVKNAPYKVGGKRYVPMNVQEALNYKETGYACWYGGTKHRLRTSSGEYINPRTSLTAAHKTLPMPCKVKVTCLKTGKSVIVRINNRGPFHSNRLIDLTSAAAHRINLNGRGIGKVRLEVVSVGDGNYEIFAR